MDNIKNLCIMSLLLLALATCGNILFAEEIRITSIQTNEDNDSGNNVENMIDNEITTNWYYMSDDSGTVWIELGFQEYFYPETLGISGVIEGLITVEYFQNGTWLSFIGAKNLEYPYMGPEWNLFDMSYDMIATNRIRLKIADPEGYIIMGNISEVKVSGTSIEDDPLCIDPAGIDPGGEMLFDHNTYTDWQIEQNDPLPVPSVHVNLGGPCTITEVKLFIDPDDCYEATTLSVTYNNGSEFLSLRDLSLIFLSNYERGWHTFSLPEPVITEELCFTVSETYVVVDGLMPGEPDFSASGSYLAGLKEVGIFGSPYTTPSRYVPCVPSSFTADQSPGFCQFFLEDMGLFEDVIIHITTPPGNSEPPVIILNGNNAAPAPYVSQTETCAVYRMILDYHMLETGLNFLTISTNGYDVSDVRIEVTDDPFISNTLYKAESPLVNRVKNDTTAISEIIVELGGLYSVERVFVRCDGNDTTGLSVDLISGGTWQQGSTDTIVKTDFSGTTIIFPVSGMADQIQLFCSLANSPSELWFSGSFIQSGAPVVRILSPKHGDIIDSNDSETNYIYGFVDNPDVDLYINDQPAWLMGTAFHEPLNSYMSYPDDSTVEVKAVDRAGAIGYDTITITYEMPFGFTINLPDEIIYTGDDSIVVSGSVSEVHTSLTINEIATPITDSLYSGTVALQSGYNRIIVQVYADIGLGHTESKERIVIRTDGHLSLLINDPVDGEYVNTNEICVRGEVASIAPATVTINGIETEVIGGLFSLSPVVLTEGENQLQVTAQNMSGGYAEKMITIYCDTLPPLAFTPQVEPGIWTNVSTPSISFSTIDEGSGIAKYDLYINDSLYESNAVSPYMLIMPLPDGAYNVKVFAMDYAGNSTLGEETFFIDTVPPVTPQGITAISGIDAVTLTWDDDPENVRSYSIERMPPFAAGMPKIITRTITGHDLGRWDDTDIISKQEYTYAIKAIDAAGNESMLAGPVTVTADFIYEEIPEEGGTLHFDNISLTFGSDTWDEAISLSIEKANTPLVPNTYAVSVSQAYDIQLYDSDGTEINENLRAPVELTFDYSDISFPDGFDASHLGIYYYQEEEGYWEKCDYGVNDYINQTITVKLLHFSKYQVQVSTYISPSLDSYYDLGVSPFQSYFDANSEHVQDGLLTLTATDLALPGRAGFDLVLKRTYDSVSAQQDKIIEKAGDNKAPVDTFGYGWSLDIPWMEQTDKGKFVRLPGGQTIKIEIKNGKFEYHEGVHFTVHYNGTYYLEMKNGTCYYFDTAGRMIQSEDPGLTNEIEYTYSGRELSYITDSVGRRISFYYTSAGGRRVISRISTSVKTIRYYYTSTGMLYEVYDPANRKTTYNYDTKTFTCGDYALWGNEAFIWYRNTNGGPGDYEERRIYVEKDNRHTYTLPLLAEIIYPTGGTSTYTYDIKNRNAFESWDEHNEYTVPLIGFPGWIADVEERYFGNVQYYGQMPLVTQHSRAGKQTTYTYQFNEKTGTLRQNTFVPAYSWLYEMTSESSGKKQTTGYKHLTFSGYYQLVDIPTEMVFYKTKLPAATTTWLNAAFHEKTNFTYHLPIQALYTESLYKNQTGGPVYILSYLYDTWGNPVWSFDTRGSLENEWEYLDHPRIKNLVSRQVTKNHDPVSNTDTETTTTTLYNSILGKPLSVSITDGQETHTTHFTYDSYGNVSTIRDPDNLLTTITYDSSHTFPTHKSSGTIIDADGNTLPPIETDYSYDDDTGLLMWEEDAEGFRTSYEYDTIDRIVRITYPDDDGDIYNNPKRQYVFNDIANTCAYTNEKGNETVFRFDEYGRIIRVEQLTPNSLYGTITNSYTYNTRGQIYTATDPMGYITNYDYDDLGRLIKITYPQVNGIRPVARLAYDHIANTVTITDENGGITTEQKNLKGQVTQTLQHCTYENEQVDYITRMMYDSVGNTVQRTNAKGGRTDSLFNGFGQAKRVQLPQALFVTDTGEQQTRPEIVYTYDSKGNVKTETDPAGNRKEYEYDRAGRLIKEIIRTTNIFTGQTSESVTKHYYNGRGNRIKIIDPEGGEWLMSYSARNYVLSETDPMGNSKHYTYDAMGNKTSETDPNGFTTYYEYDDVNRLVKTILPDTTPLDTNDNPYEETTYNQSGNIGTHRDTNGLVTMYAYTSRNKVASVSQNGVTITEYTYDAKGNVTEIQDAMGNITRNIYDSTDRLRKTIYPEGNTEQYVYDQEGNTIRTTDGKGNSTHYLYNTHNLLTSSTDALGNNTSYSYDTRANQMSMTTANGLTYTNKFDELNRPVVSTDSLGYTTKTSYTPNGNAGRVEDPRGTVWTYAYQANNLIAQCSGLGIDGSTYHVSYTYDDAGNIITVTDPGSTIAYNTDQAGTYQPDPLRRVKKVQRNFDGAEYTTAYRYNNAFQLAGITYPEAQAELSYSYDSFTRLSGIPGFTGVNGITYRPDSTPERMSYANGTQTMFAYDTNTRLTNILTASTTDYILNQIYEYDLANNISRQNEKTYSYDDTNQLTRCTTQGIFPEEKPTPGYYGHKQGDTAGIATLDFSVGSNVIVHLDYNSTSIGMDFGNGPRRIRKIVLTPDENHTTHRITANTIELYTATLYYQYVQIPADEFTFEKNENGVITITLNEVIENRYLKINVLFDERDRTYTPEDKAEFINTLGAMIAVYSEGTSRTEEYEYDRAGNRTLERITLVQTDEYESMYYTNSNRLKTDGKHAFVYDQAGNMVRKGNAFEIDGDSVTFTATEGEGVEYWEYTFDLLNRLTEVTKNGTLVAEYIYDALGYRVVKRSNGETTHYIFEGTESIFEKNVTTGEIKSYVYALGKHMARVDGVIGDSTANVCYYHNDHLGSVRAVSNSNGEVVWSADYLAFGKQVEQESQGFNEWHGFTGKAFDKDTGLYYYNARWYDASTGRFISVDPIGDGVNWYIYGNNNPLRYIDPTGLITEEQEKAAIKNGRNTQREIRRNASSVGSTYDLGFDISDQEYAAFYMFSQGMQYEYSQLYELRAAILDSVGHNFDKLSIEQQDLIYSINEQVEILEAYEGAAYSEGYKNVITSRNLAACTNFIPVFGTGQRIWEVFSGEELWSGYKYTTSERIFKGVFLAGELAAIGGAVYSAVKSNMPANAANYSGRDGNWPAINKSGNPVGDRLSSPWPESYFGKAINMANAPASSAKTALGFYRNGPWFWRQMLNESSEMFSPQNIRLIKAGKSPLVDATWAKYNPTHQSFVGDKLIHHHINQGNFATGLPESIHLNLDSLLHPFQGGN